MYKNTFIISLFALVAFFAFTSTVDAHRSGCHRWHSCPSDTGSYVCGDLGYTSGCGGATDTTGGDTTVAQPLYPTATIAPVVYTPLPTRKPTATPMPYKETPMDKKKLFKVIRVIDGDTIEVSIRGKNEKVRLLAIDTPETVDPRKPVQCFGKEASNKMLSLVSGKYVKLVDDKSQGNKDTYQRLLRYVYDEKTFINKEMVTQGYAFSYKQYPTKYLEEFNKLEKQAREKNLGLWKICQMSRF